MSIRTDIRRLGIPYGQAVDLERRRVYVGSTFSRYTEARAVIDTLTTAGHEITHDWTRTRAFAADGHPLPGTAGGYELDRADAAAHAADDLEAVRRADLLLILAETPSCGWPVEIGAALAFGTAAVWIVAPFRWTVFWALNQVVLFDDLDEPLRLLGAQPIEAAA